MKKLLNQKVCLDGNILIIMGIVLTDQICGTVRGASSKLHHR